MWQGRRLLGGLGYSQPKSIPCQRSQRQRSPRQGWAKLLQPPCPGIAHLLPGQEGLQQVGLKDHHGEGNPPVLLQGYLGPPASPVLGGPTGAIQEE